MARKATRRSAYTLAEMLLVTVILGIAGALVIPHTGQAQVLRIHAAVRTVVADITFAQTDALAYQQRRVVRFDEAENSYTIYEAVVSTGGDVTYVPLFLSGGPNGQYTVPFDVGSFEGARIRVPEFEGDGDLVFDELGSPVVDPTSDVPAGLGSVYIEGEMSVFRIDILPYTGQVVVEQVDEVPGDDEG